MFSTNVNNHGESSYFLGGEFDSFKE